MMTSLIQIFISHNIKDAEIAQDLVDLLEKALGISSDQIRCSSAIASGFEFGNSIDNQVRIDLMSAKIVIGLISKASLKSKYVLCELGACWASTNFFIPLHISPATKNELSSPLSDILAAACSEQGDMLKLIADIGEKIARTPIEAIKYHNKILDIVKKAKDERETSQNEESSFTFSKNKNLLVIGAHWDDLLLGCLGTMLKLKKLYGYKVDVAVISTAYPYGYFRGNENELLTRVNIIYEKICKQAGFENITPKLHRWMSNNRYAISDQEFRGKTDHLKLAIKQIPSLTGHSYNLIFSPPIGDRNPDHALTAETIFSTFRGPENLVLEYDIKRYTETPFVSTICVGLDEFYDEEDKITMAKKKILLLCDECRIAHSDSECSIENSGHLFSQEALTARMYINAQDNGKNRNVKFAEIFHGRIEL